MTVKIEIYDGVNWTTHKLYNSVEFDERLDEQLDTGRVQVINNTSELFHDFSMVRLTLDDGTTTKEAYFYGVDSVEMRSAGYYIHTLELCEPTRLLMGRFIDGRKVTQPVKGDKKTLKTVLDELLKVAKLLEVVDGEVYPPEFSFVDDEDEPLSSTISPEFYWNAGTSLWECLCDIGNVIDCMPRLTINSEKTAFNLIKFDKINAITGEYEI
jgi:hypothetical protein